jgi:glycosyltransferase involved in cell wall biosynthesis
MPKQKKIIIIGPVYPYRGGNSLFISYLYDILKPQFDVKIYNYKLLYPSLLFPGTTQFDESGTVIKKAPSERIVNSINPFNWIATANKIIKENADLVVFDWWHPFFGPCHFAISNLIKKKYKNKIVFITENFISHEGNAVDKTLTKIGLKNASSFVALSEIVEKDLNALAAGRKIYRSELPIFDYTESEVKTNLHSTKNELGFKEEDKVLLFFGYVRKYKGLDILLDAMPEISKKYPGIKLLVVGEFYDDPSVYINKIKELRIENNVKIINKFIPNEEVRKYYLAADLVVLPYRSATQSGILNVAYGFNKPALVTDVGGLSQFVKHKETGIIIKPDSPDAIAKGVEEFYSLREKINFEKNVAEFSAHNEFTKMPQLFEKIIAETGI